MEQEKLDEIFKKHKLWLEKVPGGERADLRWADLKRADLRWADLKRAVLREADLKAVSYTHLMYVLDNIELSHLLP